MAEIMLRLLMLVYWIQFCEWILCINEKYEKAFVLKKWGMSYASIHFLVTAPRYKYNV